MSGRAGGGCRLQMESNFSSFLPASFFPAIFVLRGVNRLLGCEWASSQQVSAGLNYMAPVSCPLRTCFACFVDSACPSLASSFPLTVAVTVGRAEDSLLVPHPLAQAWGQCPIESWLSAVLLPKLPAI